MKLVAKVNRFDMLKELWHDAGFCCYRLVGNGEVEAIYFSGSKMVWFKGKVNGEELERLKSQAWPVQDIQIDEVEGVVKISQFEG